MSLISERVEKALQRRGALDLGTIRQQAEYKNPADLADADALGERRRFIQETSRSGAAAKAAFERVIHGNELQDVNYLIRGSRVARAVGRIWIREPNGRVTGYGTGFLIGERVLLTNNHVLLSAQWAQRSEVEFEYERDEAGKQLPGVKFSLEPDELFFTHEPLDFSVVAVAPRASNADRQLGEFGMLPLVGATGKAMVGEWLSIIQHPGGELKQVCVRENRLLDKMPDVLWYSTDTTSGSSGAPVFSNDWLVVALHHSGVPETKGEHWQTIDGQDYDKNIHREEDIKWVANEGIRVSRIVETLEEHVGTHPLILSALDQSPAIISRRPEPELTRNAMNTPNPTSSSTAGRKFLLTIDANGHPSISPLPGGSATESALRNLEATRPKDPLAARQRGVSFRFDDDYSNRKGFDDDFLGTPADKGKYKVHLPKLDPGLEADAVRLLDAVNDSDYVLHYTNMSLVMHQKRCFAIYSAANVDYMNRSPSLKSRRVWRYDPRILLDFQTGEEAYGDNAFDRGHLTRQEDMEYGPTLQETLQSAADSCHWTNVVTQHGEFNQRRNWWQGIEQHILEYAVKADKGAGFRAQIFTGPVFSKGDPKYDETGDLRIPMKFWKVCAAVNSEGKLFAVAYLMDQTPVIKKHGLKEAVGEVPFAPYRLFQLPISELEAMVSLKFTYGPRNKRLSDCDPLKDAPLPILDADQDGDDDRLESRDVRSATPKGWINLTRNGPYFG